MGRLQQPQPLAAVPCGRGAQAEAPCFRGFPLSFGGSPKIRFLRSFQPHFVPGRGRRWARAALFARAAAGARSAFWRFLHFSDVFSPAAQEINFLSESVYGLLLRIAPLNLTPFERAAAK